MYETLPDYAILLVSGKRTEFYLHNKNRTSLLKGIDAELPNHHRRGGQSAPRFQRIRDEKIGWYVKKIVELMGTFYLKNGSFTLKGLILAGPAEIKDRVLSDDDFVRIFSKGLLKTLTIDEIASQSILKVINLSTDVLRSDSDENQLLQKFEAELANPMKIDLFVFGVGDELIIQFKKGIFRELYLWEKSSLINEVFDFPSKTQIHLIKSNQFISKYGEIIGIKYYFNGIEAEEEEDFN